MNLTWREEVLGILAGCALGGALAWAVLAALGVGQ
jgi:hypothetical protein